MSLIKSNYLKQFIYENYPAMNLRDENDLLELSYVEMDEFAQWLLKKLTPERITIGSRVLDRYSNPGVVVAEFENFQDLVSKSNFVTMTADQWLAAQEKPISEENLKERWFDIHIDSGGSVWTFESGLTLLCDD